MCPEQGITVVSKNMCLTRKRRKLRKTLLKEQLHEFGAVTTLHGLRYVTDRRISIFEKVFWFIIFSVSVGFCIYRIAAVWGKWQDSPVLVTVNEHLVPVGSVPFPSLTICPQMKTRATIFNYTAVQQKVFKYNPPYGKIPMEELRLFEDLMLICDDSLTQFFYSWDYNNNTQNNSSPSIIENLLKVAPDIDDVISSCRWRNKDVVCSKLFKTVLTAEGVCFSMNSIQAQEMFSKENIWGEYNYSNLTLNETKRGWTQNGYYDPNEKYPYPRRGRGNGGKTELEITFTENKSNQDEICNILNNGFKVYIQHPNNMPGSSTHFYTVTPQKQTAFALKLNILSTAEKLRDVSSETYVFILKPTNIAFALKLNILSTAEKLRDVSSETRQCYFPEEHPLRYFNIYTASNCNMECLANITYERCKCVGFYMPRENNTKICTFLDMECMESAQEILAEKQAKYSYLRTESDDNFKSCNCLQSCDSVDYDADVIRSDFNFQAYIRAMNINFHDEIIDNLTNSEYSLMRIYYKQPSYISMRRSELFGITDFLANCGGLLGLFLGFSFLSLVEIIYFITLRLWCTIKRNTKEEKTK